VKGFYILHREENEMAFTKNCYKAIELRMGFSTMFNGALEMACHLHQAIIEDVAETLIEWAVPVRESVPVLIGLGYTNVQISDAIRLLREQKAAIDLEAEYNSAEVEVLEEDLEEAA